MTTHPASELFGPEETSRVIEEASIYKAFNHVYNGRYLAYTYKRGYELNLFRGSPFIFIQTALSPALNHITNLPSRKFLPKNIQAYELIREISDIDSAINYVIPTITLDRSFYSFGYLYKAEFSFNTPKGRELRRILFLDEEDVMVVVTSILFSILNVELARHYLAFGSASDAIKQVYLFMLESDRKTEIEYKKEIKEKVKASINSLQALFNLSEVGEDLELKVVDYSTSREKFIKYFINDVSTG